MSKIERGKDAADKTTHGKSEADRKKKAADKQDVPNYDERTDDGQAIAPSDISSANDE